MGAIGLPLPGQEVKIVDAAGAELPVGSPGEVAIRGDVVMEGYKGRPEETREAIDERGFLHTGDVGYRDEDGDLFLIPPPEV